jgi:hypothetical protein
MMPTVEGVQAGEEGVDWCGKNLIHALNIEREGIHANCTGKTAIHMRSFPHLALYSTG